jgi:hypothetical protein
MEPNSTTKQISLNLIAICVFGMTLSSLVAPLFEMSSTIPLAVIFGILVIGTLDSFLLKSKISTLLLDSIAGLDPVYRQRIIHHEAGHFLVAYILDIPVTGYSLTAWEALKQGRSAQGGVMFAPLENNRISAELLQRYCTVWMAGIAAEKIIYNRAEGGSEDRQKVRSVMTIVGKPSQEITHQENLASIRAKSILETHQEAYQALVKAMTDRTSIQDCYHLLQQFKVVNAIAQK